MQLLSQKRLLVVPNPFAAPLDRNGRPAAAVQYDPDHVARGSVVYIGAERKQKLIEQRPEIGATWSPTGNQQDKYEVWFEFDLNASEVVDSQYHRQRILDGELLAADLETAKHVGIKAEEFRPPVQLLEEAKAGAVKAWKDQHGEAPKGVDSWTDKGNEKEPKTPLLANWPVAAPRPEVAPLAAKGAPAAGSDAPKADKKAPRGAGGDAL